MGTALAELVRHVAPPITTRDVAELPLLTLGQFIQGGNNNVIGQIAIRAVFLAISDLVKGSTTEQTDTELRIETSARRRFLIALAGDPDIRVQEIDNQGTIANLLSIEIKGGTDQSNAYNRGGEAEKSHRSAKDAGYQECWTVIGMNNINIDKLKGGSRSTDIWFDTAQVVAQAGADWDDFRARLNGVLGIEMQSLGS